MSVVNWHFLPHENTLFTLTINIEIVSRKWKILGFIFHLRKLLFAHEFQWAINVGS